MENLSVGAVAQVILMSRELDRAEAELRAFIDRMTEDEQAELVAVMWIGRETFGADELAEAIQTAKDEATGPTADYLLGVPLLPDYLEDGLDALGFNPSDLEDDLY